MPNPSFLRLLGPAARSTRTAAPHPRLARGGNGCRVITTSAMLAEIGEASAPVTIAQALASLSAAVDRALAQGVAA